MPRDELRHLSKEELVRRCLDPHQTDPAAIEFLLELLLARFEKEKRRFAILDDINTEEDVVILGAMQILKKLRTFQDRGPGSFDRWSWTIVCNIHRDLLRQRKRRLDVEMHLLPHSDDSESDSSDPSERTARVSHKKRRFVTGDLGDQVVATEEREKLHAAIARLSPRSQRALVMSLEGCSI